MANEKTALKEGNFPDRLSLISTFPFLSLSLIYLSPSLVILFLFYSYPLPPPTSSLSSSSSSVISPLHLFHPSSLYPLFMSSQVSSISSSLFLSFSLFSSLVFSSFLFPPLLLVLCSLVFSPQFTLLPYLLSSIVSYPLPSLLSCLKLSIPFSLFSSPLLFPLLLPSPSIALY